MCFEFFLNSSSGYSVTSVGDSYRNYIISDPDGWTESLRHETEAVCKELQVLRGKNQNGHDLGRLGAE